MRRLPKMGELPAARLALVTAHGLAAYLQGARWSESAVQWLAHELPLAEALVHIAVAHRGAPREILELVVASVPNADPDDSPKPPQTKRSRRG